MAFERLEDRRVLAAPTLGSSVPATIAMQSGTAFQIPLDGFDADNDALTYSVAVNSSTVNGFNQSFRQGDLLQIQYQQTGGAAISGTMLFKLFEDLAPRTTDHIKQLASSGFYNNVTFHRILNNFVIQGGDPTGTGSGGSNLGDFDDEYNTLAMHTQTGLLSMAKTTDDTNDSQFFITEGPQRHLDFNHSVYGMLIEGEPARAALSDVPADSNGRPTNTVRMTNLQVVADRQNGVLTLVAPNGSTGTVTLTVTVSDGSGETAQRAFTINVTGDSLDSVPFLNDVQNPQKIVLNHNGSQSFTLRATDVDGGPVRFINWATVDEIANVGGWSEAVRPFQQNPSLIVQVTDAGELTVQAPNGIAGVFPIMLAVTNRTHTGRAGVDTQIIPVYVKPPTPTIDLLPFSDTGLSDTDNVTAIADGAAPARLVFQIGNLGPGVLVDLFANGTLAFHTPVAFGGTSRPVSPLLAGRFSDGIHRFSAGETLSIGFVRVGNFREDNVVLASETSEVLPVTIDTIPPTFTVPALPSILLAGDSLNIELQSDEEGTPGFRYELQTNVNATIDTATGAITWTPTAQQSGTYEFKVKAIDLAGAASEQLFVVRVNHVPRLFGPASPVRVATGSELEFHIRALDGDFPSESLTFSLVNAPIGATITSIAPDIGRFLWTPSPNQQGVHQITIRGTDSFGQSSETTIEVIASGAPQIVPIADQTVAEHATLRLDFDATDPDLPNETLTFGIANLSGDMRIDPITGEFTWTTGEFDGGEVREIIVYVLDSTGLLGEERLNVAVTETNSPPVIQPVGLSFVDVGLELRLPIAVIDTDIPEHFTRTLMGSHPAGAAIDPFGVLLWTPDESFGGRTVQFIVRATDQAGAFDEESFFVAVVPRPMTQVFPVINGDLIINGTAGNDQVAIQGTGVPGQYRIFSILGGETVNGVTGDIRVALGDGADQLSMNLVYAAGEIEVDMGSGNDLVALGQGLVVSTAQDLSVELGEGDDSLIGSQIYVGGSQTICGNLGTDNIALAGRVGSPFWLGTSSGGQTEVAGGDGDDTIEISYSFIVGAWTIDGGTGNDSVKLRTSAAVAGTGVLGGDENDHLAIDACYFVGNLSIDGGTGSDRTELSNSISLLLTSILGSEGHDLVEVANVAVNRLRIEGAAGNDTVVIRASLLAQLFADLGDHDDALSVENNIVHGTAELHGGLGMGDWLTDRGNLFRGAIRKRTFEMFAR